MGETFCESRRGLAVAAAAAVAMSAVVLAAATAPADGREAAGVFPPWWGESRILDAAAQAGAVLAVGALPFIVRVSDPAGHAPARLHAAGALFAIDPQGLLACSQSEVRRVQIHR
jgi:hypothetical protein